MTSEAATESSLSVRRARANAKPQAGSLLQVADQECLCVRIHLIGMSRVNQYHLDAQRLQLFRELHAHDRRMRRVLVDAADLGVLVAAVVQADRRVVLGRVLARRILLDPLQNAFALLEELVEILQAKG